jgi:hypothetical protein
MKAKLLILIIAAFIATQTTFAQSVEKQVAAIRAEVTAINKAAKGYKKKVKDVEGVSLEGTEATYFTSGKGLRKIVAKIYGETSRAIAEYYYQGEDLIFVYEIMHKYNGSIGMANLKVVKTEESRMYFSGGKMIRYLLGKKQIKAGTTEFNEDEYATGEISDILKAAYNK